MRAGGRPAIVAGMIRDRSLIKVRSAKASDGETVARVFKDAWRNAYTGIIPALHLERMIRRRDAAWWRQAIKSESCLLVLEVSGAVAGYATCGAARSGAASSGEIFEIYIAPTYQGIGLGEHLFEACRHHLDQRGLRNLVVCAGRQYDSGCILLGPRRTSLPQNQRALWPDGADQNRLRVRLSATKAVLSLRDVKGIAKIQS